MAHNNLAVLESDFQPADDFSDDGLDEGSDAIAEPVTKSKGKSRKVGRADVDVERMSLINDRKRKVDIDELDAEKPEL